MRASRGMGAINPSKMPSGKRKARRDNTDFTEYKRGGKVSKVNEAGTYTKPGLRKSLFEKIKSLDSLVSSQRNIINSLSNRRPNIISIKC